MPDAPIAQALSGIQAPSQGSTLNDAQGALAAYLSGVQAKRRENEAKALEQAKLEVEKRRVGAQEVQAEAMTAQARAQLRNADSTARQVDLAAEAMPSEIRAREAQAGYQEASTATLTRTEEELRLALPGLIAEGRTYLPQNEWHRIDAMAASPRAMSDWITSERQRRFAESQQRGNVAMAAGQHEAALASQLQDSFTRTQELEDALRDGVGFRVNNPNILVTHPHTGDMVTKAMLIEEFGSNIDLAQIYLTTDPELYMLQGQIEEEKQANAAMRESFLRSSQALSDILSATIETVGGQEQRGIAEAAAGTPGAEPLLESMGLSTDNPPPPPPALDQQQLDSVVGLARDNPEAVASMMPTLARRFPGIDQQLAASGVDPEALAHRNATRIRTDEAFQRAEAEMAQGYSPPAAFQGMSPDRFLPALRAYMGKGMSNAVTSVAGADSIVSADNAAAMARSALQTATIMAQNGASVTDIESKLRPDERDSYVWQLIKARWPTRIGAAPQGR